MTTWLSRLPNTWGSDRYAIHQEVWRAFPLQHGENQPFVYRVETDRVLVRSSVEPYWDGHARAKWTRETLPEGRLSLDLHLNVHRRCTGKDLPVQQEDVEPFVLRKLEQAGLAFAREDLDILPFRAEYTAKAKVPLFPVSVHVVANVVNADSFKAAFSLGLGRAKFLGFGMLLIEG